MISIFLGAGFSAPAGVPLASQLFEYKPVVDKITRERLVERVLQRWNYWKESTGCTPEEYLAMLQGRGGKAWLDACWYVGLVIAINMGRVETVGMNPTITRHNLDRTTGVLTHESFWSSIFQKTQDICVLTTNYDILAERGIRIAPRPRVPRPGFHYGWGPEELEGGGYPSYTHIQKAVIAGSVPIFKLHGSISWSYRDHQLMRYIDCRPAIRGDAAILAPVTAKALPNYLEPIWVNAKRALESSHTWLIVGYSLPEYDKLVRELFSQAASNELEVHIFNPNPDVASRFRVLLGDRTIVLHKGLPAGLDDLDAILKARIKA